MLIKTANEAIEYIHSLKRFGKKSGLSNITVMLERLGNPHKGQRFVHVAGTNGKGSVSNMIKNILASHGYKVGYYTSPYIEFFSERICIGNEMISDSDLVLYTNKVKEVSADIHPIEFEFITAMAFLYFKDKCCDVTVLEVGLGGRLDSTNVIDTPLLNVITPIGFDHTAILGSTLSQIASEKAGTIKENSTVVITQKMPPECVEVIKAKCIATSSELIVPGGEPCDVKLSLTGTSFTYKNKPYTLSLKGTYQLDNAITAIEASYALMNKLELCEADIQKGLASSFWKCRFEVVPSKPAVVLDGAHNSHGIKALIDSIDAYFPNGRRVFLFSMLSEKDWHDSARLIANKADSIVVTTVPSIRETATDEMYDFLTSEGAECICIDDYKAAYVKALELAGEDGTVFVFGSLYLAGAIRLEMSRFISM